MKSVAVYGSLLAENPVFTEADLCDGVTKTPIEGVSIPFGRVETPEPNFDPQSAAHQTKVLIQVRAFSCNYRDKVTTLAPGDRVMANNAIQPQIGLVSSPASRPAKRRNAMQFSMQRNWSRFLP